MAKPYLIETMQNDILDLDIVKIFYGIHFSWPQPSIISFLITEIFLYLNMDTFCWVHWLWKALHGVISSIYVLKAGGPGINSSQSKNVGNI